MSMKSALIYSLPICFLILICSDPFKPVNLPKPLIKNDNIICVHSKGKSKTALSHFNDFLKTEEPTKPNFNAHLSAFTANLFTEMEN